MRHTCAALMIAAGAHPEHIKRHLGHSSITVTMDLYGHLFLSEQDSIAERLDEMMRESLTDKGRTKLAGRPPKDTEDTPPQAPDQGVFEWARQDLNLQPTDYESAALTRLSYGPEIFNYNGSPALSLEYLESHRFPLDATEIESDHIRRLLGHVLDTRAAATGRQRYASLKQLFKWLEEEGQIASDPMSRVKPPKVV